MSKKIARITQDKKLLLANDVVEDNTKIKLNSDGRLDTNEIIEYPAELEGGRNLLKQKSDGNYSDVYRDVIIQDGIMYWTQITKATSPFTFHLYDTTLKTDDFIFSFKTNQIQELRPFIYADGKMLHCSPVIVEYEDYYHVSMIFKNITISNYVYFYGTEPFEPPKEVQFWDFKLEKGNIATPWTPAPEDLGLNYPDSIQNFNPSISGNNIIAPDFIEGYPFVKPVIDDSLVLWLDGSTGNNYEQTGTWKDLSGNGNDGQLMNFDFTEDSGWVDGSLKFDGVNDYVQLPDLNLNPDNFTIQVDNKIRAFNGDKVITENGDEWGRNLFSQTNYSHHSNAGYNPRWTSAVIKVEPNTEYTISYTVTQSNRFGVYQGDLTDGLLSPLKNESTVFPYMPTIIGDRIIKTIITGEIGEYIAIYLSNQAGNIKEPNLKVEKGSTATPWTPAPEDITETNIINHTTPFVKNNTIHTLRFYNRALTDEEILQNYQAGQCSPLLAMRGDAIG